MSSEERFCPSPELGDFSHINSFDDLVWFGVVRNSSVESEASSENCCSWSKSGPAIQHKAGLLTNAYQRI